jgi:hypothetical protein
METKGIEVSLTTRNLNATRLKWTTSFNFFSLWSKKITRLQNNPTRVSWRYRWKYSWHPRNALYSYQFTGLNNQGLPTFVMAEGKKIILLVQIFKILKTLLSIWNMKGRSSLINLQVFQILYDNWSLNVFIVAAGGNKVRLNSICWTIWQYLQKNSLTGGLMLVMKHSNHSCNRWPAFNS